MYLIPFFTNVAPDLMIFFTVLNGFFFLLFFTGIVDANSDDDDDDDDDAADDDDINIDFDGDINEFCLKHDFLKL